MTCLQMTEVSKITTMAPSFLRKHTQTLSFHTKQELPNLSNKNCYQSLSQPLLKLDPHLALFQEPSCLITFSCDLFLEHKDCVSLIM